MENLPEDRPITCRDTTWLVSAARDGELDEAGHAALQKHIADCPFCREASRAIYRPVSQPGFAAG
jgi:anti-sigma factor RsiW